MSPLERKIWHLWRIGWNTAKIAAHLDMSEAEVDRILHRIRTE